MAHVAVQHPDLTEPVMVQPVEGSDRPARIYLAPTLDGLYTPYALRTPAEEGSFRSSSSPTATAAGSPGSSGACGRTATSWSACSRPGTPAPGDATRLPGELRPARGRRQAGNLGVVGPPTARLHLPGGRPRRHASGGRRPGALHRRDHRVPGQSPRLSGSPTIGANNFRRIRAPRPNRRLTTEREIPRTRRAMGR